MRGRFASGDNQDPTEEAPRFEDLVTDIKKGRHDGNQKMAERFVSRTSRNSMAVRDSSRGPGPAVRESSGSRERFNAQSAAMYYPQKNTPRGANNNIAPRRTGSTLFGSSQQNLLGQGTAETIYDDVNQHLQLAPGTVDGTISASAMIGQDQTGRAESSESTQ